MINGASRRGHDLVEARARRVYRREEDDVLAQLDEALRALHRELGDGRVVLGMLVERRGDDLAVDRALHVGHLFRTLVDEQRDDVRFRMVDRDRVRDVLESVVLPAFGGETMSARCPLPMEREIDDARRELRRANLEMIMLVRVHRRALLRSCAVRGSPRDPGVDFVDAHEPVILLIVFWPAACPSIVSPRRSSYRRTCCLAHVDVVVADDVALASEKAVSLWKDVEDAAHGFDVRDRAACAARILRR